MTVRRRVITTAARLLLVAWLLALATPLVASADSGDVSRVSAGIGQVIQPNDLGYPPPLQG